MNRKYSIFFAGLGVAVLGFVHGFAHDSEIPNTLNKIEYIAGILITTLGLHAIGAVVGLLILEEKGISIVRLIGLILSIIGVRFTFFKF